MRGREWAVFTAAWRTFQRVDELAYAMLTGSHDFSGARVDLMNDADAATVCFAVDSVRDDTRADCVCRRR